MGSACRRRARFSPRPALCSYGLNVHFERVTVCLVLSVRMCSVLGRRFFRECTACARHAFVAGSRSLASTLLAPCLSDRCDEQTLKLAATYLDASKSSRTNERGVYLELLHPCHALLCATEKSCRAQPQQPLRHNPPGIGKADGCARPKPQRERYIG